MFLQSVLRFAAVSGLFLMSSLPFQVFAEDEDQAAPEQIEEEKITVVSDRPNFANAPVIIGHGALGLELGASYTGNRPGRSDSLGTQVKLRYGLFRSFELQVGWNVINWQDNRSSDSEFGIGDGFVNGRVIVLEGFDWVPQLGFEFGSTLPFADRRPEFGKGKPDFTLNALIEFAPSDWFWLDCNVGVTFQSQRGSDREFRAQEFVIAAAGLNLEGTYSPYTEIAWFATHGDGEGDQLIGDIGILVAINENWMVDGAVFVGLEEDSPDLGITIGLATILGRFKPLALKP